MKRNICSILLLLVFATTSATKQDDTTRQESMPKQIVAHCISAKQPVAERTISHLFDERIVLPIRAVSELPGFHPGSSKFKCLHTPECPSYRSTHLFFTNISELHLSPFPFHVIDYYIYTLEHILI
ncbi:MAG: hypothetical protein J6B31_02905 [Bacteroidaceae bacterium]|nr:hypothetical protein [Bacteroidaceae bacterium]